MPLNSIIQTDFSKMIRAVINTITSNVYLSFLPVFLYKVYLVNINYFKISVSYYFCGQIYNLQVRKTITQYTIHLLHNITQNSLFTSYITFLNFFQFCSNCNKFLTRKFPLSITNDILVRRYFTYTSFLYY